MSYKYNCNIKECKNSHYALGLCKKHWARFKRNGYTDKKRSIKIKGRCVICKNEYLYYSKNKRATCSSKCGKINIINVHKGKKNYNWNGGCSKYPNHSFFKKQRIIILEKNTYSCEKCGKKEKVLVHHKDFTKTNHELNNLMVLCYSCHRIAHETAT